MFQLNELNSLVSQLKATQLSFEGYFDALRLIALIVFFFLKFLLVPAAVFLFVVGLNKCFKLVIVKKLAPATKDLIVLSVKSVKEKEKMNWTISVDKSKFQELVLRRAFLYKMFISATYVLFVFSTSPFLFVNECLRVCMILVYAAVCFLLVVCVWHEEAYMIYPDYDIDSNKVSEYCFFSECWEFDSKDKAITWAKENTKDENYITVKE